jgi:hypothetical protein
MVTAIEVQDYACQSVEWAVEQSPPSHCCVFDGVQVNVEYCVGGDHYSLVDPAVSRLTDVPTSRLPSRSFNKQSMVLILHLST